LEPICVFFTNASVVTDLSAVKRLSGRAEIAVDSRCKVVMAVKFVKDAGSDPAGKALLPMT